MRRRPPHSLPHLRMHSKRSYVSHVSIEHIYSTDYRLLSNSKLSQNGKFKIYNEFCTRITFFSSTQKTSPKYSYVILPIGTNVSARQMENCQTEFNLTGVVRAPNVICWHAFEHTEKQVKPWVVSSANEEINTKRMFWCWFRHNRHQNISIYTFPVLRYTENSDLNSMFLRKQLSKWLKSRCVANREIARR